MCRDRLDVHQAVRGGVCDKLACRKARAVEWPAQRQREELAAVRQAATAYRARVAPTLDIPDPHSLTLAVVPAFERAVRNVPQSRRQELQAHLVRVVGQAFEETLDATGRSTLADEISQMEKPVSEFRAGGGACATCRGHCCRGGGNHAYLDATAIRIYLARHPGEGLSERDVVDAFLEKVPDATFENSCVYHGRRGCTLSREMRSSTCNIYQCAGLKELRETLADCEPRPVLVVAANSPKISRATLLDANGNKRDHASTKRQ